MTTCVTSGWQALLTIAGAGRDTPVVARRERAAPFCARVALDAPARGRSASPLDRHMGAFARFQTQHQWSLIPGPRRLARPVNSQDVQDVQLYAVVMIADTLLSFSGMRLLTPEEPSWWKWRARWESDHDFIELGMTLFDDKVPNWGGSPIHADCTPDAIDALWSYMQSRHPAVWYTSPNARCIRMSLFGNMWRSNNRWRGP